MKKTRGSQHSAWPNSRGSRFINFSFMKVKRNLLTKKWIAVCGRTLCGGLNALLYVAVIFITHRKTNMVIFYIIFSFMKVFLKK